MFDDELLLVGMVTGERLLTRKNQEKGIRMLLGAACLQLCHHQQPPRAQ